MNRYPFRKKLFFSLILFTLLLTNTIASVNAEEKTPSPASVQQIPRSNLTPQASPHWIQVLPAAKTAQQLFIVGAVNGTTAWISLHEKNDDGQWQQLMSTPGFIGKNGLGKVKEGDNKTPVGTFHFTTAFGIAPDPGSILPYQQVDENIYWSGDSRPGMKYNEMVDIRQYPDLNKESSEHIIDYNPHYIYCLNISYNETGTPGLGSAIFLHCLGPYKPYTGGCVAIPEDKMHFVLQHVRPECKVVIDSLTNLGGTL
ncbi:MAG: L,D-transpeptidase family protein [Selenomonas sp.]|uniref:L,D-transpeptidase family protein n=1 Tax=Selenomonas sp. TaxID=2053611 RepID=UPI0025F5D2C2|nr:L,D-transpeptidase family protein [Selenomonas sp.]MCR5757090.1 L,D-transpeptidase family protein [Selenomonas sp.]